MNKATYTRKLAIEALLAVEANGRQSHLVLQESLQKLRVKNAENGEERAREAAFLTRLVEGTIEYRLQLDYVIGLYASTKLSAMRPQIREILRMAVYEILHMDAVPDRAAVNEAVLLTKEKGFGSLTRFVNGVLRRIAAEKERIPWPDREQDRERFLSVMYSVPEDLVRRWCRRFGADRTEEISNAFLEDKKICVRAVGPSGSFAFLEKGTDLSSLADFREGRIFVQDLSSQLAVTALDIKPGDAVLDLCAAPGGKTLFAAGLCAGGNAVQSDPRAGRVYARDLSAVRLERIRENLVRCHIDNVDLKAADALVFDTALEERFDIVIADLPCSGYGVAAKKPEVKYKPYEETVLPLARLQREILENAVRYVRPGGKLLYSTCTIAEEENEENVRYLLDSFGPDSPGIVPAEEGGQRCFLAYTDSKDVLPEDTFIPGEGSEGVQLLPGSGDWDGFFFAVFHKQRREGS